MISSSAVKAKIFEFLSVMISIDLMRKVNVLGTMHASLKISMAMKMYD